VQESLVLSSARRRESCEKESRAGDGADKMRSSGHQTRAGVEVGFYCHRAANDISHAVRLGFRNTAADVNGAEPSTWFTMVLLGQGAF
jgi:hypothetical protein